MDQVRVGVVGVGLMGSLFARLAAESRDSELVGVVDIDLERAGQLGESLKAPVYGNHVDLLESAQPDAVVIATPDAQHLEPSLAAARAGAHILLEKPLATNPGDAQSIIDACKSAEITLMVAHVLRFDPNYGEAYRAVRDGSLGEIVHLCARRNTQVSDAERLAGRVTITMYLGIHSVDVMQWVLGSPIVEVRSIGVSKAMKRFNVDDTVMSLVRFENGAIGTLENSWLRPNGTACRRIGSSLVMMGTKGAYRAEPYHEASTLYQPGHAEPVFMAYSHGKTHLGTIGGLYRDEFAHFVACVKTGAAPIVSPAQALSAVVVCNAIERSLREGIPVQVDQGNAFA